MNKRQINCFPERPPRSVCLCGFLFLLSASAGLAGEKIVIAHRGASGYLPEHTLEAKALAYGMGADYLEQDVVLSKDEVPMVLHDIHLETTTDVAEKFPARARKDGRFYALDFTCAELKTLRATERFSAKTGKRVFERRFPLWKSAFSLSTLQEELQMIQGLNSSTGKNVGVYPEIKQPAWHRSEGKDISKIVLQVLDRHGYKTKQDRFYLQCFEYEEVQRIRGELGFAGKMILLMGKPPGAADSNATGKKSIVPSLKEAAAVVDGIGPEVKLIVSGKKDGAWRVTDLAKEAHALKLEIHPYTVRADDLPPFAAGDEELFDALYGAADVEGLFTDFPDRAVNFLRSMRK